jgi:predicted transcriptional regulator
MNFQDKITVRIPKEMKRKLTRQAKARMLHPADLAREALAEFLKLRARAGQPRYRKMQVSEAMIETTERRAI